MQLEDSIALTWTTIAIALLIGSAIGHQVGVWRATRYCMKKLEETMASAGAAAKATIQQHAEATRDVMAENQRYRRALEAKNDIIEARNATIRALRQELERIRGAEPIQPTRERGQ